MTVFDDFFNFVQDDSPEGREVSGGVFSCFLGIFGLVCAPSGSQITLERPHRANLWGRFLVIGRVFDDFSNLVQNDSPKGREVSGGVYRCFLRIFGLVCAPSDSQIT